MPIKKIFLIRKAQIQNKKNQGRENYPKQRKKKLKTHLLAQKLIVSQFVNMDLKVSIFFLVGSDGKYFSCVSQYHLNYSTFHLLTKQSRQAQMNEHSCICPGS